jgi:hypothetical protein
MTAQVYHVHKPAFSKKIRADCFAKDQRNHWKIVCIGHKSGDFHAVMKNGKPGGLPLVGLPVDRAEG